MQMMYEIIAREIKYMNLENVYPQDYLNFYCLGNREELPSNQTCVLNNGETVKFHLSKKMTNYYVCAMRGNIS